MSFAPRFVIEVRAACRAVISGREEGKAERSRRRSVGLESMLPWRVRRRPPWSGVVSLQGSWMGGERALVEDLEDLETRDERFGGGGVHGGEESCGIR